MEETIGKWKNLDSVYHLDGHLATCNHIPGKQVYGEKLVEIQGNMSHELFIVQMHPIKITNDPPTEKYIKKKTNDYIPFCIGK